MVNQPASHSAVQLLTRVDSMVNDLLAKRKAQKELLSEQTSGAALDAVAGAKVLVAIQYHTLPYPAFLA